MCETISVIMATYNCEATVTRAIDSILAQTYENWVMIICDDGSTDGTREILRQYAQAHPGKFRLLENERNRKLPYSLNRCLEQVETELVARMDGDDWCAPDRFEKQAAFLRANQDCDLVGTGIVVTDGTRDISTIIRPERPCPEDMLRTVAFSHATILTYRRVYDDLGGYSLDPSVERCEDLDLWCRFFAAGFRGNNLPDLLYYMREDRNAVKRRTLRNRLNTARTLMAGYRRMGLSGIACYKKAYGQVLLWFLPVGIYQKLHLWKLNREKS